MGPLSAAHRATLLGLLASTAPIAGAMAQPAPAADPQAEASSEIIVTAQKRDQRLQDVPISIQALTNARIEQLHVARFEDYVRYLPSVAYSTGSTGIPGNTSVSFRGIATDAGLIPAGTLPTVGVYLDEQPITSISGTVDAHIYDIARIEALAGPQGTLYGASSEAGTIRIITNKPDASKFSASYDLELNQIFKGGFGGSAEGYVNMPIVADRVALRVVGWYNHIGGYIDNVFRARTFPTSRIVQTNQATVGDDLNEVDTFGARAQLGIDIDDNWTITPSINAQKTTWDGSFQSDDDKVGELKTAHFFPEFGRDEWYQAGATITGRIADFELTYAGYYMDRTRFEQNDYADYGFFYDLVAGSGAGVVDNAGRLIDPSQVNRNRADLTKHSQELRLASPQTERFRGLVGVFYQRQTLRDQNDYITPGFADRLSVPGRPGQVWLTLQERFDRDYAVFGQADFDVTDRLTLTGGLRGYKFDNSLVGFFGVNTTYFGTGVRQCLGRAGGGGPFGVGVAVVDGTPCTNVGVLNSDGSISPRRSKGDGVTWRLNASLKPDDDHLIYATASTGFRPGGINRAVFTDPAFGEDRLYNYEIGTKNSFADGALTLNLTAFYLDWKDVQVTFQAPGGSGVAQITNAGGARSKGLEGDFAWIMTPGLTLRGAATYVDAKLTSALFTGAATPAAPKGQRLPLTPQFKGNLIGRYEWALGNYDAHFQVAAAHTGSSNPVIVTRDLAKTGKLRAYTTVDASAGVRRGNMSFEIYGRNLTDARGQKSRAARCNINFCGPSSADPVGEVYNIYIVPRSVGVRFGQRF